MENEWRMDKECMFVMTIRFKTNVFILELLKGSRRNTIKYLDNSKTLKGLTMTQTSKLDWQLLQLDDMVSAWLVVKSTFIMLFFFFF